jgi:hypothetical protein
MLAVLGALLKLLTWIGYLFMVVLLVLIVILVIVYVIMWLFVEVAEWWDERKGYY